MPESFTEDISEEQILEGTDEHENFRFFGKKINIKFPTINFSNLANIFKNQQKLRQEQARRNREREEQARRNRQLLEQNMRRLREREQMLRNEINTSNSLKIQIPQLQSSSMQLDIEIIQKDRIIDEKNKKIKYLTSENTRLKTKNNALIDNFKSFKSLVLGNDKTSGYVDTVVKQEVENDALRESEIGEPSETTTAAEGFLNNFSIMNKITRISMQIQNIQPQNRERQTMVNNLQRNVNRLQNIIREKTILIDKKTKHISYLMRENKRLKKKNNSLLDKFQYYRSLVLGNDSVDGYKDTAVKQSLIHSTLQQQEVGNPIAIANKTEGFISGSAATYNAVVSQNQIVENQITNVKNDSTINNQLTSNYITKRSMMRNINTVLIFIFFGVFLFGCYKLYMIPQINMSIYIKIMVGVAMLLSIFILHLIEYILLYSVPYISALLIGTAYTPTTYWRIPGIYDYLP